MRIKENLIRSRSYQVISQNLVKSTLMDMIFNNDDMTRLTLIIGKNIIVHIQNIIWLFGLLFNPSYDP